MKLLGQKIDKERIIAYIFLFPGLLLITLFIIVPAI